jgi:competence protein ComEC
MKYLFWFLLLSIFVFRYFTTLPHYIDGDRIIINSTVLSEPILYDTSQYLKLKGLKIYLPLNPIVNYGDKVVIEGTVKEGKLDKPILKEIQQTDNLLFNLRTKIVSFYKSNIPEPHSSLIAGVTLGSKQSIPESFMDKLKNTGTAHVVVASGTNVTLVGGFLISTLVNFMTRRKALVIACLGIWLYTFMSGFDAPLVRAAIMGTLAFTAQEYGRVNDSLRALFLSVAIMLIINPSWVSDIGFILSFAATLSLILFQSKVDRLISFVPTIIRQDLSTTLAAQIGVAPILYFTFGQFNIFSPFINVLILWTIPFITIIGMVAGILSILSPYLASFVLYLTYPFTLYFVTIVDWLS